MPKVTVVLPVHDERAPVRRAIASALDQSFTDFELIIVDDGTGNELQPIVSWALNDNRVRVEKHRSNRGASAARNSGVGLADSEYIAFLDSDDAWYKNKLLQQLAWMQSDDRRRDVSCTGFRLITPFRPQGEFRQSPSIVHFRNLLWGCGISPGSTMMVRSDVFDRVGLFDESLRRLEDWDWLLRCAQVTPIGVVPEILALVDASIRESDQLSKMQDAAERMRTNIRSGRYQESGRQRRLLMSTLNTEVSAAAFRGRHYGVATTAFLRALYYHPKKSLSFYRRIFNAIWADLSDAGSRTRRWVKDHYSPKVRD